MTAAVRRVVITGGPGSGKSTLIAALDEAGHRVVEEAGRAVIRDQMAAGGNALPWGDPHHFARAMLARDIDAWHATADADGPVFFDRGIPDIQGYLRVIGAAPLAEVDTAARAYRYAPCIFIAPPWQAIYVQDDERRQDFAEARRTFAVMCGVYGALGYEPVPLPLAPVAERVAFVLAHLD